MVEGQRFELWEGFHPRRFSRPVLSATQPTLQESGDIITDNFYTSTTKLDFLFSTF